MTEKEEMKALGFHYKSYREYHHPKHKITVTADRRGARPWWAMVERDDEKPRYLSRNPDRAFVGLRKFASPVAAACEALKVLAGCKVKSALKPKPEKSPFKVGDKLYFVDWRYDAERKKDYFLREIVIEKITRSYIWARGHYDNGTPYRDLTCCQLDGKQIKDGGALYTSPEQWGEECARRDAWNRIRKFVEKRYIAPDGVDLAAVAKLLGMSDA